MGSLTDLDSPGLEPGFPAPWRIVTAPEVAEAVAGGGYVLVLAVPDAFDVPAELAHRVAAAAVAFGIREALVEPVGGDGCTVTLYLGGAVVSSFDPDLEARRLLVYPAIRG